MRRVFYSAELEKIGRGVYLERERRVDMYDGEKQYTRSRRRRFCNCMNEETAQFNGSGNIRCSLEA